jgi:NAD(P)-dependent dehydrogenase (short-subunit alcohol dehydrogenase family)
MDVRGVVLVTGAGKSFPCCLLSDDTTGAACSRKAGSGIGRAVSQRLASLGVDMLVCADINFELAEETAAICQETRSTGLKRLHTAVYSVDVRNEAAVNSLVSEVAETHGRIDILVNTAGVSSLEERQEEPN